MPRFSSFCTSARASRAPLTQTLRRTLAVALSISLGAAGGARSVHAQAVSDGSCEVALVFHDGAEGSTICSDVARAEGYDVVDLGDDWVPSVLAEPPNAASAMRQTYRATYVALANEQENAVPPNQRFERFLELYGIEPSLRVIRERMLDDARHQCDQAVADEALRVLDRTITAWEPDPAARQRAVNGARSMAISAMQQHLRCASLLGARFEPGVFGYTTVLALRQFQRAQALVSPPVLNMDTRDALLAGSRELVFRSALRVLRERVADATSTIEDGSAAGRAGTVLGRVLDSPELRVASAYEALPSAADDLLSALTEAAARELGWTDPVGLARFFRARDRTFTRTLRVALRLPPRPAYHSAHMELRAEIDRGDVVYTLPRVQNGVPRNPGVERRPTLVLYARDGAAWKPLVRYSTTIGGWQNEQTAFGEVRPHYKESPVGPRLWRDIVAAPVWLPPARTPDSELVEGDAQKGWRIKRELIGPGYRSAYGLAMLVHLRPREVAGGTELVTADRDLFGDEACCVDEGVRTHGSVSYASILHGYSHGCHRLFNHLALRLMGFLLAHRNHVRIGDIHVRYDRVVSAEGKQLPLHVRSRGYRYQLVPPVPVDVLEGRVRGRRPSPAPRLQVQREPEPVIDSGSIARAEP